MSIAGESRVSALRMTLVDGALHSDGQTMQVPVSVTYSRWGGGMGTLEDAVRQMRAGSSVVVDVRGNSYMDVMKIVKDAE